MIQAEDMTVQLRAQGLAPRDCVGDAAKIPLFDDKDIKSFVPSVYIGRDVVASIGKKPEVGQSKGFAFIEFTHHTHALACLRELNNNPAYSEKFAIFGKKAAEAKKSGRRAGLGDGFFNDEGKLLIPRLIVDFTVENKAKAKQQQQRRELQIKNHLKQKQNSKETKIKNDEVKKDKKGRGSLQREKKRKLKELGESDSKVKTKQKKTKKPLNEKEQAEKKVVKERVKKVKPPKKRKVDNEAVEFDNMVRSYKNAFGLNMESTEKVEKDNPRDVVSKKRWYE